MDSKLKIALFGCGKMGSALLRGWIDSEIAEHITVVDPYGLPSEFEQYKDNLLTFHSDLTEISSRSEQVDAIILAVKPQLVGDVCVKINDLKLASTNTIFISIAAGQSLNNIEAAIGNTYPVIRAMPNTPAAIGKAITAACPNSAAQKQERQKAQKILSAIGIVEWIADESLMDAITAVSGSGPAYLFYLIEALAAAGEKAGLDNELSIKLARQTVIGAAGLAENENELSAAQLRENVTSPGGTTAAALEVLMDGELQEIMNMAVKAATKRSKDLNS